MAGLLDGSPRVDWVTSLPDSILNPVTAALTERPEVTAVACTSERDGIGAALGAALGGKVPVALMEASGLGECGLILGRHPAHRVPLLILASHSELYNEERDYHFATIRCTAILDAFGIPYDTLTPDMDLAWRARSALVTAVGQRRAVALLVPPGVLS